MPQRDLLLARLLRHAAVERVEALEPRVRVVVAVRVLAVAQQVAGELDLVRRVVREEPRRARLPQARLEHDRRHGEQARRRRRQGDGRPAGPRGSQRRDDGGQRDEHARPAAPAHARPRCPTRRRRRAPARRTGPVACTVPGRKLHGSEPSSWTVTSTSAPSAPSSSQTSRRETTRPACTNARPVRAPMRLAAAREEPMRASARGRAPPRRRPRARPREADPRRRRRTRASARRGR